MTTPALELSWTTFARFVLIAACIALLIAGIAQNQPVLRALVLPLAVGAVLLPRLIHGCGTAWLKLLAAALITAPVAIWPLVGRLLPAAIMAVVGMIFALSLIPGRVPLVERMARAIHETRNELPPADLAGYRRTWTWIWAAWLIAIATAIAAVAVAWPTTMGSLACVSAIPVAIFGLLALEFHIRGWWLGDRESMSFREFLLAITALRWEHLRT